MNQNYDPDRCRFHRLDLNYDTMDIAAIITDAMPCYVINFASQSEVSPSWDTPGDWYQTNCVAIADLITMLRDETGIIKYLHISTPEVYGSCTGNVTEDYPHNPSTPYAASRAASEVFLNLMKREYNFPVVMVRSTNVYGAHQQLWKIIPRTIINLKLGKTIQLHGGGTQVRQFIHIRDVSRAEMLVLYGGSNVYNISPSVSVTIAGIVNTVCTIMGYDMDRYTTIVPPRRGSDNTYTLDSSRLRNELRWSDQVDIRYGIEEAIMWVEDNWDEIQQCDMEYIHLS